MVTSVRRLATEVPGTYAHSLALANMCEAACNAIGANGLLMQYCALTGNWSIWAVLWSIEPLSVGLALLLVNIQKHRPGLLIAGLILCTIAGFAALGMSYIIPGYGWVNLMGPGILLLAGLLLLSSSLLRSTPGQAAIES